MTTADSLRDDEKGLGAPAVLPDHPSRASFEAKHPNGDEVPGMIRLAFFRLWCDGWDAALAAPIPPDAPELSMSMFANRQDYETARLAEAVQRPAGEDRADAERYRWLRAQKYIDIGMAWFVPMHEKEELTPEAMDAAIDTQLHAAGGRTPPGAIPGTYIEETQRSSHADGSDDKETVGAPQAVEALIEALQACVDEIQYLRRFAKAGGMPVGHWLKLQATQEAAGRALASSRIPPKPLTDEEIDEIIVARIYDGDWDAIYQEDWIKEVGRPLARAIESALRTPPKGG